MSERVSHTWEHSDACALLDEESTRGCTCRNLGSDVIDSAFDSFPRLLEPVWALFSGGYDSLAAAIEAERHPRFAGVIHIRTGTGVDETYEYVRQIAARRGWPLRVYEPAERDSYERLVATYGMPGPGFHAVPYRWLKERQIQHATRDLKVGGDRQALVALVSGARAQESKRRSLTTVAGAIQKAQEHAQVYVSPILDWTKSDVLDAIAAAGVPESEVVTTIHKSGECLCGAFAAPGELEELSAWWPRAAQRLYDWQKLAYSLGQHWKWGERPSAIPREQESLWVSEDAPPPGPLCASCVL